MLQVIAVVTGMLGIAIICSPPAMDWENSKAPRGPCSSSLRYMLVRGDPPRPSSQTDCLAAPTRSVGDDICERTSPAAGLAC
jgi:hypothetical protein